MPSARDKEGQRNANGKVYLKVSEDIFRETNLANVKQLKCGGKNNSNQSYSWLSLNFLK